MAANGNATDAMRITHSWADLEASDNEDPSPAELTASPVTGHTDGRPDNAIRALGRREGRCLPPRVETHPVRSVSATSGTPTAR